MAATEPLLGHLRKLAATPSSDGELLQRFVQQRDEAAFTAILQRHGPMVWGVCRRAAGQHQDAEDAFQATFVLLARKAASLRRQEALAGWLYGVACRVALKARDAARLRARHEARAAVERAADPLDEISVREAQRILDEELSRLSEKLRAAVVLCHLEGATRDEAARQLGWSLATLKRRLGQARALLRVRLERRGLTLSAALLGVLLEPAAVPAALLSGTLRAAAGAAPANAMALADWAAGTFLAARLKAAVALAVMLAVLASGVAFVSSQPPGPPAPPAAARDAAPEPPRLDAHGDPLPPGALLRLGTVRLRQGDPVEAAAFLPGGKVLATGGQDHLVRLWDVPSGKELRRLAGHTHIISAVAVSADGKLLASGGYDKVIRLWDPATGQSVGRFGEQGEFIQALALSADGKLLASLRFPHELCVWDVPAGKASWRLTLPEDRRPFALALSPDGKVLAAPCADGDVRLWDAPGGKELHRLTLGGGPIRCVAFAPDGKHLVTGADLRPLRLWDVATGKDVRQLGEHRDAVRAVAFTPDGKAVASLEGDRRVRLWGLEGGREIRTFEGGSEAICGLCVSPDGRRLATWARGNAVRLWDVDSATEVQARAGHRGGVGSVAFAPDGRRLASGGRDGAVCFWDARTGRPERTLAAHERDVSQVALSPDGRWLGTTSRAEPGARLWTLPGLGAGPRLAQKGAPYGVAFSPDGKLAAVADVGGGIPIYHADTGKDYHWLAGHSDFVMAVAFAPDGRRLASAGLDGTVRLWDVTSGEEVWRFTEHPTFSGSLAFSADGRYFACGNLHQQRIHVWAMPPGAKALYVLPSGGEVASLALSPDGRTLAAGCARSVALWETATGQPRATFAGHQAQVRSVAFSPNGAALASASDDSTALLWEVAARPSGRELTAKELEACWDDLAGGDARRAFRAVQALAASPGQAVALLGERLRPVPRAVPDEVARRVADLGSQRFAEREKATAALEKLGGEAEAALRAALTDQAPLEVRQRVARLLAKLHEPIASAELLGGLRALEVLEHVGTTEARAVLRRVADGAEAARLTREAGATLRRLGP